MSDASADPDVTKLLADLTRELRDLQREVEPDRERSLRRDLARFTSEVAIPGLILLLKTNIQALELIRRAIRIADGRQPRRERVDSEVRERAERLGQVTLARLDDVLSELQGAVEDRPQDDRSVELIEEARAIRQQIQEEFETDDEDVEEVNIDVEEELRALKDDLDDNGNEGADGGRGSGRDEHSGGDSRDGIDGGAGPDNGTGGVDTDDGDTR
jgi:Asp-tRNA(Asn)/Glu-tRNA(Gln) amidotransferase A subunit family amidase